MNNPNAFLHDFMFNHTDPKVPYCPLYRWAYHPNYPVRLWTKDKRAPEEARNKELQFAALINES